MDLHIEADGLTAAEAALARVGAVAADIETVVFPAIIADFRRIEAARWASNGPGWDKLTPTTVAIKARRGYPQPERIMFGRGTLYASLTSYTDHTAIHATPESLFIGTDLPYAQYHQQGPRQIKVFGRAAATLPERPVVHLSEVDAHRWCEMVREVLRGGTVL